MAETVVKAQPDETAEAASTASVVATTAAGGASGTRSNKKSTIHKPANFGDRSVGAVGPGRRDWVPRVL
jgi:hypothetical protein